MRTETLRGRKNDPYAKPSSGGNSASRAFLITCLRGVPGNPAPSGSPGLRRRPPTGRSRRRGRSNPRRTRALRRRRRVCRRTGRGWGCSRCRAPGLARRWPGHRRPRRWRCGWARRGRVDPRWGSPRWSRGPGRGRRRCPSRPPRCTLRCLHGHDGTYIGIKAGCYDMYLIMVYS